MKLLMTIVNFMHVTIFHFTNTPWQDKINSLPYRPVVDILSINLNVLAYVR